VIKTINENYQQNIALPSAGLERVLVCTVNQVARRSEDALDQVGVVFIFNVVQDFAHNVLLPLQLALHLATKYI